MSTLKSLLRRRWDIIIPCFLLLVIVLTNYEPGTYLIGWDNLQTDLNPWLGVQRAWWSSWQEYQSFGLPAGMAHASDLVRSLTIWIMSLVLPSSILRYALYFVLIGTGIFGIYRLLQYLLPQNNVISTGENRIRKFGVCIGVCTYLFNIGSTQILAVPFEPYQYFYAFLPWLIWIYLRILNTNLRVKKSELALFILLHILATPLAYAQQLFFVYLLYLGAITLMRIVWLIRTVPNGDIKSIASTIRKSIGVGILILCINAFWIFPQIYFLSTNAKVIYQAKMNQTATEDIITTVRNNSNIERFLTLKNHFLDSHDTGHNTVLSPWRKHFESIPGVIASWALALLFLNGLFTGALRGKSGFVAWVVVCAIFLLPTYPIFGELNTSVRDISIINQIFRSAYTKLSIPWAMTYSLFAATGAVSLLNFWKQYWSKAICALILIAAIGIYSLPAFSGNYLADAMRQQIPTEYQSVMKYLKVQDPNRRIALLPDYTAISWFNLSWGYNGSGFMWYGVQQPMISRTFDVWSKTSESFYFEMSRAIGAESSSDVKKVLLKYRVGYVLFDESVVPISGQYRSINYDRDLAVLNRVQGMSRVLEQGKLVLYKFEEHAHDSGPISRLSSSVQTPTSVYSSDLDPIYQSYGHYVLSDQSPETSKLYAPFADFTSKMGIPNKKWSLSSTSTEWQIVTKLNFLNDQPVRVETIDEKIRVNKSKEGIMLSIQKNLFKTVELHQLEYVDCASGSRKDIDLGHSSVYVEAEYGESVCFAIHDDSWDMGSGYLVEVDMEFDGNAPRFAVTDHTKKQTFIDGVLRSNGNNYVIIPPHFNRSVGGTISFNLNSEKYGSSHVLIRGIRIYSFPVMAVQSVILSQGQPPYANSVTSDLEYAKYGYHLYNIKYESESNDNFVVVWQEYQDSWFAYDLTDANIFEQIFPVLFAENRRLTQHVAVNGWANGWKVPDLNKSIESVGKATNINTHTKEIMAVFWPQYLQYFGYFALFVGVFVAFQFTSSFVRKTKNYLSMLTTSWQRLSRWIIDYRINFILLTVSHLVIAYIILITNPVFFVRGDFYEYFGMTQSIYNHKSLAFTHADELDMTRQPAPFIKNEYYPTNAYGERMATHFWLYSILATPFRIALEFFGFSGWLAFAVLNTFISYITLVLMRVYLKSIFSLRQITLAQIFLVFSPYAQYIFWSGPELFIVCTLTLAISAYFAKKYLLSGVIMCMMCWQSAPLSLLTFGTIVTLLLSRKIKILSTLMLLILMILPNIYAFLNFGTLHIQSQIAGISWTNISIQRLYELFADLNIGIFWYHPLPYILLFVMIVYILFDSRRQLHAMSRHHLLLLLFCGSLSVTLLAYSMTDNWNHGMSGYGPTRYSLVLIPLTATLCAYLLRKTLVNTRLIAVIAFTHICVQIIIAQLNGGLLGMNVFETPLSFRISPLAKFVLNTVPSSYNPTPEIFVDRLIGKDSDVKYALYTDAKGMCKKVLYRRYNVTDIEKLEASCGKVALADRVITANGLLKRSLILSLRYAVISKPTNILKSIDLPQVLTPFQSDRLKKTESNTARWILSKGGSVSVYIPEGYILEPEYITADGEYAAF